MATPRAVVIPRLRESGNLTQIVGVGERKHLELPHSGACGTANRARATAMTSRGERLLLRRDELIYTALRCEVVIKIRRSPAPTASRVHHSNCSYKGENSLEHLRHSFPLTLRRQGAICARSAMSDRSMTARKPRRQGSRRVKSNGKSMR